MNRLKLFSVIFLASLGLLCLPVAVEAATSSNPLNEACSSNLKTRESPLCKQAEAQSTKNPIAGPSGVINKAANFVAIVAALGAVINIIIGAFEFVTAGGTGFKSATANPAPTKAAKARSRVVSGVIGLAIVAMAWVIVRIVTDRVLK